MKYAIFDSIVMGDFFQRLIPLIKWGVSGGFAVIIDVSLLFLLVEFVHVHYLLATSTAFLVSATTNYTISRLAIFQNAQYSISRSYATFMSISLIGLAVINICMYVFVDIFGVHFVISRILIAGTLGILSFFLHKNLSFNDIAGTR